jgi:hypothetical protein
MKKLLMFCSLIVGVSALQAGNNSGDEYPSNASFNSSFASGLGNGSFTLNKEGTHPSLKQAEEEYSNANATFKSFAKALEIANKDKELFTPEEQTRFENLQRKAVTMIDKSIQENKSIDSKLVRPKSDIDDAISMHLHEALKADNDNNPEEKEYHINQANKLMDMQPKTKPLEMRDYRPSNTELDQMRQRQTRKASEDEGWDLVEDTGR